MGRDRGRCARYRTPVSRAREHTGGEGPAEVACVDCRRWVKRAQAVKHRSDGWPSFYRCARCTADVTEHLAELMALPLLPDPDDLAPPA